MQDLAALRPLLRWYDGPAEWLPIYDRCRYLRDWVAVKHRWRLTVDSTEKAALAAAGALIGAVMKEMRGQADANRVRELILEKLT